MSNNKRYLLVPSIYKKYVKEYGAKFDFRCKRWYLESDHVGIGFYTFAKKKLKIETYEKLIHKNLTDNERECYMNCESLEQLKTYELREKVYNIIHDYLSLE